MSTFFGKGARRPARAGIAPRTEAPATIDVLPELPKRHRVSLRGVNTPGLHSTPAEITDTEGGRIFLGLGVVDQTPPAWLVRGGTVLLECGLGERFYRIPCRVRAHLPPDRLVLESAGPPEVMQRRRFARVDAELPMSWRPVSAAEYPGVRRGVLERGEALPPAKARPEREARREGSDIAARLKALETSVAELSGKLDQVLELLGARGEEASGPTGSGSRRRTQQICLSGSGMRFFDDTPIERGVLLLVSLELPLDEGVVVHAVAEVRGCEEWIDRRGQRRHGIACAWQDIRESDRDEVVRFTFQRQRQLARSEGG